MITKTKTTDMKKIMHFALVAVMALAMGSTFSSCGGSDDNNALYALLNAKTNDQMVDMLRGTWTIEPAYLEGESASSYDEVTSTMTVTVAKQPITNTEKTSYTLVFNIITNTKKAILDSTSPTGSSILDVNRPYVKSAVFILDRDDTANTIVGQLDDIWYRNITANSFQFSFDGFTWYTAKK